MRILKLKQSIISNAQSTNIIDWKDILANKHSEYGIQITPALQALLDLYSLPEDEENALSVITGQLSLRNVIDSIDSLITLGWTSINAWKAIDRVADKIKIDSTSEEIVATLSSNKQLPDLPPGVQSIKSELMKFKKSISKWRNAIGLLKNSNNPDYYEFFAPAKGAVSALLSPEVQNYINGVEVSMFGSIQKEIPGGIQTLKWLKDTIKPKVEEQLKQDQNRPTSKKVSIKPDIKKIDFNNPDEVSEAIEHLDDVKKEFVDYDPNNKEHFNRVYLLGIEAGKEVFSNEILKYRGKKYNCDNYQAGMSLASTKMKANTDNSNTVLSLYDYGKNIDEVINFAEWVSFLLCIAESKVSSIDPGTLEKVCEKYVLRLNSRFPAWTKISDFSKLPFLMQADKAKQINPEDNYDDAVMEGINLFFNNIVADQVKYSVEEESGGSEKALQIMNSKKQEIKDLAKRNNTNPKSFYRFVVAASFLFCLIGSKTKSNSPKAVSNLWAQYSTQMSQGIPNWNEIKELSELNILKNDGFGIPTKETASAKDIKAVWQSGITQGLSGFNELRNDKNIEFKGDVSDAEQAARIYMDGVSDQVATNILLSKSFNQKALLTFSYHATIIYAMVKAKAVGVGNYNLKANLTEMFRKLQINWQGWEDTQIFSELERMKTAGGFGSSFSPQKSMEIWQNLMPKAIARIKAEVDKNPALSNNQKFRYLLSNGWVLSKPNQLEEVFGEKLVFPESVQVAKETVYYSSTLKASNIDLTADYILNRIAAWCSGKGDYTDLEPSYNQNMAKKYYPGNQEDVSNQQERGQKQPGWSDFPSFEQSSPGLNPSNQKQIHSQSEGAIVKRPEIGITQERQQPQQSRPVEQNPIQLEPAKVENIKVKNGVYVGFQFLGTISVALAILLSKATERENLILE